MGIINQIAPLYKGRASKREVRHSFFSEIKTELQSYLLGFIMADGSINDKRWTLSININKQDCEIFKYFKIISPNAYIREQKAYKSVALCREKHIENNGSIRLSIASKVLINDLHKLGVIENKTYSLIYIPEQIPQELIRHFIRGYFDGDGCFSGCVSMFNKCNKETSYHIRMQVSFFQKYNSMLTDIQKYFSNYNINIGIYYKQRDDMFYGEVSKRDSIIKIFHLFYKDSIFYLLRKFNKFNYYVNTEVSQIITNYCNAQRMNVNKSDNFSTSARHEE